VLTWLILTGWEHDESSRAFAEDIRSALHDAGYFKLATAADVMGLKETHLVSQLQGHERLNAWLLPRLGPVFMRRLAIRHLQRLGRCLVIDQPELVELVNFARTIRVRMAKRALEQHEQKREVA
jgi:hypothetical protein